MQEPLIQKILKLTKYTFARELSSRHGCRQRALSPDTFSKHLAEVTSLMKQVTLDDIGLQNSPSLFPSLHQRPTYLEETHSETGKDTSSSDGLDEVQDKATVTYIGVYENCDISVGVFIVAAKTGLPLHNHPGMNGILKVVQGSLNVSAHDKMPDFDITRDQKNIPKRLRETRMDWIERGFIVPVKTVFHNATLTASSNPLLLGPESGNYHKIYNPGDEPAAFLDILSPPYNHKGSELALDGDSDPRECEYYKELRLPPSDDGNGDNNITWLQMIPTPADFICDSETYQGPTLEI